MNCRKTPLELILTAALSASTEADPKNRLGRLAERAKNEAENTNNAYL